MMCWNSQERWLVALLSCSLLVVAACNDGNPSAAKGVDENVTKLGSIEIAAKLIEIALLARRCAAQPIETPQSFQVFTLFYAAFSGRQNRHPLLAQPRWIVYDTS